VFVGKGVESGIDKIAVGLGVFQFFELFHALLIIETGHLHLRHLPALDFVELLAQDDLRVLEDGFDECQQHQGVVRRLGVEQGQGLEQVKRKRLIHREIVLQLDVHPQITAGFGSGNELDDPAVQE